MPEVNQVNKNPANPEKIDESLLPQTVKVDKDSPLRSIFKALSWRVIATTITILIVFVTTKEWDLALGAGAADLVIKLVAYYIHERVWTNVKWGKTWQKNKLVRAVKLWNLRRKRAKRVF